MCVPASELPTRRSSRAFAAAGRAAALSQKRPLCRAKAPVTTVAQVVIVREAWETGWVSFFDEPVPVPPQQHDFRNPEWSGPPDNVIPATVALDVILVRRPDLGVWVADALAFPTGLRFGLNILRREPESDHKPLFFGPPTPDALRFGLRLADGTKVLGDRPTLNSSEAPEQPVLRPTSGSGGQHFSQQKWWLWPLPPSGSLTFVLSWPAEDIEETSAQTDAAPILAAAARAEQLWVDDRPVWPDGD